MSRRDDVRKELEARIEPGKFAQGLIDLTEGKDVRAKVRGYELISRYLEKAPKDDGMEGGVRLNLRSVLSGGAIDPEPEVRRRRKPRA